MTLDKWINDYCEENNIELPDNIADNKTALRFLQLEPASGGGGGESNVVRINCDHDTLTLDKTFAELFDMLREGKLIYFNMVYNDPEDFDGYDDTYVYGMYSYMLVEMYKYDTAYRCIFTNGNTVSVSTSVSVGRPAMLTFQATDSESYPVFYKRSYVKSTSIEVDGNALIP